MSHDDFSVWIWRGFRLALPAGWEMLQFSRGAEAGRCAWADRCQFRFELSWRKVPSRPEMDRLMSDYLGKLVNDQGMAEARAMRKASWRGIVGRIDAVWTSRFSGFLERSSCLVEMVFIWPDRRDEDLERSVLKGVDEEPAQNGLQHWRAFGLELFADEDLDLTDCVVEPARALLVFSRPKSGRRQRFERLGMVDSWLAGSVRDWFAAQCNAETAGAAVAVDRRAGHEIVDVQAPADNPDRRGYFSRRTCRLAGRAWVCPRDGRLYRAECIAPARYADAPDATDRLRCCESLGAMR